LRRLTATAPVVSSDRLAWRGMLKAMVRAKTLLLGAVVACARAQTPNGDLLQRVTGRVLDTVDRLPRYMCTQTISRSQYELVPHSKGNGCEPAAHLRPVITTSDRLRLDVAVSAGREMYSWVGESHFEDRSLFDLVGNGALSTGSFSAFLTVIFRVDGVAFSDRGPVEQDGRQLEQFTFQVSRQMSHYTFSGAGHHFITGYYGSIFVDPKTADLVRLEVHTDVLPPETGSCQSSTTLDYHHQRLNDTDFLLPWRTQLSIVDENGAEMRNTAVFSGCHEFLGESTLSFDAAPDPAEGSAAKTSAAAELPDDLPFQIVLDRRLDPATAAAGDKLAARLSGPIRGPKREILVPKGAAVTVRIVEIRRYYEPAPALRLVLKPETVEIAGTARPLSARPDIHEPMLARAGDAMRRRVPPEMQVVADSRDPRAAVFLFVRAGSNFTVAAFESSWRTAAKP
jgi:hypothetical protein